MLTIRLFILYYLYYKNCKQNETWSCYFKNNKKHKKMSVIY